MWNGALILSLGCWLAGDRSDSKTIGVGNQLADDTLADGIERLTVIREQALRYSSGLNTFAEHFHCVCPVF